MLVTLLFSIRSLDASLRSVLIAQYAFSNFLSALPPLMLSPLAMTALNSEHLFGSNANVSTVPVRSFALEHRSPDHFVLAYDVGEAFKRVLNLSRKIESSKSR